MKIMSLATAVMALVLVAPAFATQLNVPMNQSGIVRFEGTAATIIVGNPMVADVAVVEGNTIVIQGRIFGNTDVIVLDSQGRELINLEVSVTDRWAGGLTIHRGNQTPGLRSESVNYVCNPVCVRALHPGDEQQEAEDFASQGGRWQDLTQRGMMLGDEAQQ